jgi:hypothetical protein
MPVVELFAKKVCRRVVFTRRLKESERNKDMFIDLMQ